MDKYKNKKSIFHNLNQIRSVKVKYRLVISFLMLSILPLLILGNISYNKSNEAIKNKISTYSVQLMNQLLMTFSTNPILL